MSDVSEKKNAERPDSPDDADRVLLERVSAGDRRALHSLYVTYYPRLLRFLYRLTGRLEAAQEGVNDVMLVVWEKASSFNGRSKVTTWIMGIAYRKGLKELEKSRRWSQRFKSVDPLTWDEPFVSSTEHTEGAVLADLLASGLERLPPEQRAVVELTYFHGYSYQEIGEILSCPVNTVKTRMFHARAKLRKLLPELGADGRRS